MHQQGGSGVTLWAAISYYGLSTIAVIDGTIDSEKYIQVLNKCLLPLASEECPTDRIYTTIIMHYVMQDMLQSSFYRTVTETFYHGPLSPLIQIL